MICGVSWIEVYVMKVNPTNCPLVVGTLIDLDCSEDFIKTLLQGVRGACPIEPLCAEVEKRNRSMGVSDMHMCELAGAMFMDQLQAQEKKTPKTLAVGTQIIADLEYFLELISPVFGAGYALPGIAYCLQQLSTYDCKLFDTKQF